MKWFNIMKIEEVEQVGQDLLNYVVELEDLFEDLMQLHLVMLDLARDVERQHPEIIEELGQIPHANIQRAMEITRELHAQTSDKRRDIHAIVDAERIDIPALYFELTENDWQEMREFLERMPRDFLQVMDRQELPPMPDIVRMTEIVDMFREPDEDWTQMTD